MHKMNNVHLSRVYKITLLIGRSCALRRQITDLPSIKTYSAQTCSRKSHP